MHCSSNLRTKRQREPVQYFPAKRQKIPTRIEITIQELMGKIAQKVAKGSADPDATLQRLLNYKLKLENGTFKPLLTDNHLWVLVPNAKGKEIYLDFHFFQSVYYTQYFEQTQLYPGNSDETQHWMLQIQEWEGRKNPVAEMRLGKFSEILWIRKGENITGGIVQKLCMQLFRKFHLADRVFLLDSAKVCLAEKKKVSLASLYRISSPNGKTWYENAQCKLASFHNWSCTVIGKRSQDPSAYEGALRSVRGVSIAALVNMFKSVQLKRVWLIKLAAQYFPGRKLSGITLHDLAYRVHFVYNSRLKSGALDSEIINQLHALFKGCMEPNFHKKSSPGHDKFQHDLMILYTSELYEMDFG